jgi:hypothetical protein
VFNYKPKLEHIKPAMLRQETVNAISIFFCHMTNDRLLQRAV